MRHFNNPSDRSKPMSIDVAKRHLGSDYMYRVALRDLVRAKERIRFAAIKVPTERILGASATPPESLDLWHQRLAYHHPRGISEGISQGLIGGPSLAAEKRSPSRTGAPLTMDGVRRTRRPPLGLWAVQKTIRSVVTDLEGPFSVEGPHGELYLQLFTDCDDKWRVVKFLTKKSDCLRTLQEFLLMDVQAEGLKVENLHADGAPELISAASVALVAKQGGMLTYSPSYTPEMNGLAERGNQTAYNGEYAMLLASNLPASFWVYAVECAVVVYNTCRQRLRRVGCSLSTLALAKWEMSRDLRCGDVSHIYIFLRRCETLH
jgi:hypothetical protein